MSEAESDFLSFPKIIKVAKKRAQMLRQFAQSPELNLKQREAAKSTAIVARQQVEDTKKRQAEIRAGAQIVKANTEQTREERAVKAVRRRKAKAGRRERKKAKKKEI